jgi:hypothetical protein
LLVLQDEFILPLSRCNNNYLACKTIKFAKS